VSLVLSAGKKEEKREIEKGKSYRKRRGILNSLQREKEKEGICYLEETTCSGKGKKGRTEIVIQFQEKVHAWIRGRSSLGGEKRLLLFLKELSISGRREIISWKVKRKGKKIKAFFRVNLSLARREII